MTADLISILKDLFVNRTDCYCKQLKQGGYSKIPQPLTDEVLQQHLDGKTTVGSYQLDLNNLVKWLCLDLDPEKLTAPQETAKAILTVMRTKVEDSDGNENPRIWNHSIILEASRYPDKSYHIWVLFMVPVKAKVARWIALRILEMVKLNPKQIEVFPKQNEITPEHPYGNFVKLPFGKHQVEQKYSRMLDLDTFEPLPIEELENKHGLSFSEADTAIMEKMQTKTNVQLSFAPNPPTTKLLTAKDTEQTIQFLMKYWINGYRNEIVISFCGMCIKKGITHEATRNVIAELCNRTATSDFDRQEFLAKVDYQYSHRKNIGNLKGISGIYEVIKAINQHQGVTEAVEVPPWH